MSGLLGGGGRDAGGDGFGGVGVGVEGGECKSNLRGGGGGGVEGGEGEGGVGEFGREEGGLELPLVGDKVMDSGESTCS